MCFGKKKNGILSSMTAPPRQTKPSHQAPMNRGSFCSNVGLSFAGTRSKSTKMLRKVEPKRKPRRGPMETAMNRKAG